LAILGTFQMTEIQVFLFHNAMLATHMIRQR
jgi:hypothetical protein